MDDDSLFGNNPLFASVAEDQRALGLQNYLDEQDIRDGDELMLDGALEDRPLLPTTALSQRSLETQPAQNAQGKALQTGGNTVSEGLDGPKIWSRFEDEELFRIWPTKGTHKAKAAVFNKITGSSKNAQSLRHRFDKLTDHEWPKREKGESWTQDEEDTLRESWNELSVKPTYKERALRYNSIERPRTVKALTSKYNVMISARKAQPTSQLELITDFRKIWINSELTVEDRTESIKVQLNVTHITGELAASYHNLIREDAQGRELDAEKHGR